MNKQLIFCFFVIYFIEFCCGSLVDGIIPVSWQSSQQTQIVDRFLWNKSRIQLKLVCLDRNQFSNREKSSNQSKSFDVKIKIQGRIGRVKDCLPLETDSLIRSRSDTQNKLSRDDLTTFYDNLWDRMEKKTFEAHQDGCDPIENHLFIDNYSNFIPREALEKQLNTQIQEKQSISISNQEINSNDDQSLLTWSDGYYLIEFDLPQVFLTDDENKFDVDLRVSIKNSQNGYLTADQYPTYIFYGIMCAIYALLALLWFICCFIYWKELLKIQFAIGFVILIGMIEKSLFVAEYDGLNKSGQRISYSLIIAEIFSSLKRTVSRVLVVIVAIGYGLVRPFLGTFKEKIFVMGFIYFVNSSIEGILRINSKTDETNRKVLLSRMFLIVFDSIICYWILTGLLNTTRTLRMKKNFVKLNVYRHFTSTILFSIFISILFMIWSVKRHLFTDCITNWRIFWIDDAFWHLLFLFILLVIMILFRPSNNNQRYAFMPLLDHSDNEDLDQFDEEQGESTLFESITWRRTTTNERRTSQKTSQERDLNSIHSTKSTGNIDETLTWIENSIPTSFTDQALRAFEDNQTDDKQTDLGIKTQ